MKPSQNNLIIYHTQRSISLLKKKKKIIIIIMMNHFRSSHHINTTQILHNIKQFSFLGFHPNILIYMILFSVA